MARSDSKKSEIELHSDAWSRFERAIDVVAKSPPQHRKKEREPAEAGPRRSAKKPNKNRESPKDRS
jgi:hypothetical protein